MSRNNSTGMTSTHYDVVVIGGGHNGLTCGAYLAKADKHTLVLESRHVIGSAAVTEEFTPGFSDGIIDSQVLLPPDIAVKGSGPFFSNIHNNSSNQGFAKSTRSDFAKA